MLKPTTLLLGLLLLAGSASAQDYILRFTRTRYPVFDAGKYKQVGIGDIVGPTGTPTQSSLNLTDDLTVDLVKQQTPTCEILDHTALNRLYGSKSSTTTIINETTMASLAKKTQSAVLLVGRIQSDKVSQTLKTESSGVQTCPTNYWYESFGDFTLQIKIFDVKTAKMLHAEVIKIPMTHKSKKDCKEQGKLEETQIQRQAAEEAAAQVARLLFPYEEALQVELWSPLLGNPFKNSRNASALFNTGDHKGALDILAGYTTDPSVKEKFRPMAFSNYGCCLYADGQFALAKEQFLKAYALSPSTIAYKNSANMMDKEMQLGAMAATSSARPR